MIEPALHLRVAQGHPGAKRMYVRTILNVHVYTCIYKYTDRGPLSSYRPGSLLLAQLCKEIMLKVPSNRRDGLTEYPLSITFQHVHAQCTSVVLLKMCFFLNTMHNLHIA